MASYFKVLQQLKKDASRIQELQGMLDQADEEDYEPSEENPALPSAYSKQLKEDRKEPVNTVKEALKLLKIQIGDAFNQIKAEAGLPKGTKKGNYIKGLTQKEVNFTVYQMVGQLARAQNVKLNNQEKIELLARNGEIAINQIVEIDAKLAAHKALEDELKQLKAGIKEAEKRKDELVQAAREKITPEEAKALIEARFNKQIKESFEVYIRQLLSQLIKAVENLHNKYAVTVKDILAERDEQATLMDGFLLALGYE